MNLQESITQLESMDPGLSQLRGSGYEQALALARNIVSELEQDPSRKDLIEPEAFSQLLTVVQRLAFTDLDQGSDTFLADWCDRQWASRLQSNPYDSRSRLGLARSWLWKAQPSLARIERQDDISQSAQNSANHEGLASSIRARRAVVDTDRTESADYVEARDFLRPAMEQVDQALAIMNRSGRADGSILELAAETYMHYGNVSHPRENETSYQRALNCLLQVNELSDYDMDTHLREFFDENIDYITEEDPLWYTLLEISI